MSDSAGLWIVAHQASLSMGFPRQEYWSGLPFPSRGDLPDPGMEPMAFMSPAVLPGKQEHQESPIYKIADEKFLVSVGSSSTLYYIVSFLWVFIHYFPLYIVSTLKAGTTFCLAVYPQHLEEYLKYNRCK